MILAIMGVCSVVFLLYILIALVLECVTDGKDEGK